MKRVDVHYSATRTARATAEGAEKSRRRRGALRRPGVAGAVLSGTPARFGTPASQLRSFTDSTGALRYEARRVVDTAAALEVGRG